MDAKDGHPVNPLSLHKYLYVENNPINATDPLGLDMWVAQGETALGLHEAFDVGDPNGFYNRYEFGMPGGIFGFAKSLLGVQNSDGYVTAEVNRTKTPTILYRFGYIYSTPAQDAEVIKEMTKIVGEKRNYSLTSYNCHTFAEGLFLGIARTFPKQYSPPRISAGLYNGPASMYYSFGY